MKYSIIIPTIGRDSLKHVLDGILSCNDFKKINPEILVIFDGNKSKDFSFKNIEVLETKTKVYAGGARNFGIEKAKGDILIFIGDNGVPDKNWLSRIVKFHEEFSEKNIVLLGKTEWKEKTDFTDFLENKAQFNYKTIIKSGATWRHFYTANISLKKEFLGLERFSNKFKGWGFEDSELGYRLEQKGMSLVFDGEIKIYRTDCPTLVDVIEKTKSSRNNAIVFENLHPEVRIIPRGIKRIVLFILIFSIKPFSSFFKKIKWWSEWKKAWIGILNK